MATREALTGGDRIKTITAHYIDGAFVESHGGEVMDIIKPTNGQLIGRVTLGDEEDTRRAIAAAKRAFETFGRTTKEERASYLGQLHAAVSARIDDLTAAMVEEYGGVVQFVKPLVESGAAAFLASQKAVHRDTVDTKLGQDDGYSGTSGRGGPNYRLERECAVHLPQACIGRRRRLYGCPQAQ